MVRLLDKNQRLFFTSIVFVLLCSSPLFFLVMKHFYTKDVDSSLIYRSNELIEKYLEDIRPDEIDRFNTHNDDYQILPFSTNYRTDKIFRVNKSGIAAGNGTDYRILYKKINIGGEDYILMTRMGVMENRDMIVTLISQYGILIFIFIICILSVQKYASKKSWEPFYDILSKIENFNLADNKIPEFDKTDIIEFSRLEQKISALMKNNLLAYKRQREFIENASHEMQTPLAVLNTKLDILLQDNDITPRQAEIISSLYEMSSRLNHLTKSLLFLAKINNEQFSETEDIEFTGQLEKQLGYLDSIIESHRISLHITIANKLHIRANRVLLDSLINNLVTNAIRHNSERKLIYISVDGNKFTVANTGSNIPLDGKELFMRFSQKTKWKAGNGLGLAISWQICQLHGWQPGYEYKDNLHCFSIEFKEGVIAGDPAAGHAVVE